MPRDAFGNYTLPPIYEVAVGDDLLITQHNTPLEDIQDELSDSLSRSGNGGMTAALDMGDNRIEDVADPTGNSHAMPRSYADTRYLQLTGDSITGDTDITGDFDVTGDVEITGNTTADGTLDVTGHLAIDGGSGLSMGSSFVAAVDDLSEHLKLYGATYGVSITDGLLNVVVPASANVNVVQDGGVIAYFDDDDTGTAGETTVMTRRKGDARYLALDGGTMTDDIDMGGHRLDNVGNPSSSDDAMPRNYADNRYLKLAGGSMAGSIDMGGNRLDAVGDPSSSDDAMPRSYTDDRYIRVDPGGGSGQTDFNVGHRLMAYDPTPTYRNFAQTVRLETANSYRYRTNGAGDALDGTWRACGDAGGSFVMFRRVS